MKRFRFAMIVSAGMLVGCEGAVLVNNRPDRNGTTTAPAAPTEAKQASATIPPDSTNLNDARTAATTQPADQTVQTKNTRIESHSD